MKPCLEGKPPMLCFQYKNVHIHFLGFVHGQPPKYIISEKFKKELDEEIKNADIVFAESYSKKSFEESIGFAFPEPRNRWIPLDSNKAIDRLVDKVGPGKAIRMLERIKYAPLKKKGTATGKPSMMIKALRGEHKTLQILQLKKPVCYGVECIWDELRNLTWVEKILAEMYDEKNSKGIIFLVLAGVGHNEIINLLEKPERFEKEYKRYYGPMSWKAHEMTEILQRTVKNLKEK